jgi:hypothetical protein
MLRVLFVLALSCLPVYAAAESVRRVQFEGVCLTPWECVQWCYERGCLTTTGCDPSTDGCFCANCS